MSFHRSLRGGCSCGRNQYTVIIPQNATEVPQVLFDNDPLHRRSQATPLSAWLRVPLSWYHSATYAFFDDETHNSIRRSYTSPLEQSSKRYFCGFCGTPLTYWSESPPSEADYISLTLGSLTGPDLRDLEDMGVLPKEAFDSDSDERTGPETVVIGESNQLEPEIEEREIVPWFETLVQGSRLGKIRRSKGQRRSNDGRTRVEWEIVEWTDDGGDGENAGSSKRKLDAFEGGETVMSGGL
ncbi:hypothetical protein F5884DRAFT_773086 [Xylogone sp. PMI_703]|nr:hypothetical protein F5884DRAFT_773086 [Xylogone sp. PMI_703]